MNAVYTNGSAGCVSLNRGLSRMSEISIRGGVGGEGGEGSVGWESSLELEKG